MSFDDFRYVMVPFSHHLNPAAEKNNSPPATPPCGLSITFTVACLPRTALYLFINGMKNTILSLRTEEEFLNCEGGSPVIMFFLSIATSIVIDISFKT